LQSKDGTTIDNYISSWKTSREAGSPTKKGNPTAEKQKTTDFSIPIINKDNGANYFRSVIGDVFRTPAVTVGGVVGNLFLRMFNADPIVWAKTGILTRDFYGTLITDKDINYHY
jgi:hypothetical protein